MKIDNLEKFFEEVYKDGVLKQTHFIEITAEGFAHSLRKTVFNKKEIDTIDAALGAVKNARKAAQQAKYERDRNGNIIENGATHLQFNNGNFCNKDEFLDEFADEHFEDKPDLVGQDTANVMVNEYLSAFDDDGWLISLVDTDGYNQIQNARH